jgi:Protein of unknown function (DUF1517)
MRRNIYSLSKKNGCDSGNNDPRLPVRPTIRQQQPPQHSSLLQVGPTVTPHPTKRVFLLRMTNQCSFVHNVMMMVVVLVIVSGCCCDAFLVPHSTAVPMTKVPVQLQLQQASMTGWKLKKKFHHLHNERSLYIRTLRLQQVGNTDGITSHRSLQRSGIIISVRQVVRSIQQRFLSTTLRNIRRQHASTSLFRRILAGNRMNPIRRMICCLTVAVWISLYTLFVPTISLGTAHAAAAVPTGGRMGGGSFKPSTSRNIGTSSSSSSSRHGRITSLPRPTTSAQPRGMLHTTTSHTQQHQLPRIFNTPIILNSVSGYRTSGSGWYAPTHDRAVLLSRVSTKDIVLVTGTGMLLAYGYQKNSARNRNDDGTDSLLGYGYTVGSMTVALDIPNRSSTTDNILHRLNQLAMSADTMTKRGLQDLLSSVTLELLRHEQSITSAYATSKSYPIIGQAEREFQVLSVASQSKVDRLTGM